MFLSLLLLLCFITYSETPPPISVTGEKGSGVTLPCPFNASSISHIDLRRYAKTILDCQNEKCEIKSGRVSKKGSCDIILMNLILSDAGKYRLKVNINTTQTELDLDTQEYHLHIHDEISEKIDGKLKLDVLLPNAEKVEHRTINSTEWTVVWTRSDGVQMRDRVNDSDGNLTISRFTANDTGTYRVLDSEGETLITVTVTVTASNTGPKGKLEIDEDETNAVESWIIVLSVIGALVLLGLIIFAVIWIYKHQHWNTEHQAVPMDDREQQNI